MPELPEVETLRRSLEPTLVGRSIESVHVLRRDMVCAPGDPSGGFSRSRSTQPPVRLRRDWLLNGATITRLTRHGKQLGIETADARAIVVHLGMTGGLRTLATRETAPPHTHAVWTLDDGRRLVFCDARRFGLIRLLPGGTTPVWSALGPDALSIRAPDLAARLARTARTVKAALLDQHVLAGVGNIYADEALFASRVHPETRSDRLDASRVRALAASIRKILRLAIERRGSTIRDYRDASGRSGGFQDAHAVYGRADLPCVRCGASLALSRVAQRATVHCPGCQATESPNRGASSGSTG